MLSLRIMQQDSAQHCTMPELPDIEAYAHALRRLVVGHPLQNISVTSPFLLRSVEPPIDVVEGSVVKGISRLGKRVVFETNPAGRESVFMIVHLMIAGRFLWLEPGKKPPGRITQALFRFPHGTLALTEASTQKRASLTLIEGLKGLAAHDPGGMDPLSADLRSFAAALQATNRTIKRALTDPRTFSGIGNAYSDEILHAARLSPIAQTQKLSHEQIAQLHLAMQQTLTHWCDKLRAEFDGHFPKSGEVTAFRPEFAVHGKFGQACPVCGSPVQRIVRADNEINYCATCQTDGTVLADRSLSRLLKDDWPRTLEEWQAE